MGDCGGRISRLREDRQRGVGIISVCVAPILSDESRRPREKAVVAVVVSIASSALRYILFNYNNFTREDLIRLKRVWELVIAL